MNQLVQEEVRGGRIESDENCWQWGPGPFFFSLRHYKNHTPSKSSTKHFFCFRALAPPSPFFPFSSSRPTTTTSTHSNTCKRQEKQNKRADLIIRSPPNQKLWQVRISRSRSDAGRNGPMLTSAGEKPESPSSSYW